MAVPPREGSTRQLGYHADWSIEDVRYIPQNLGIRLGSLPYVLPSARTYALGPDFQPDQPLCVAPGSTRGLFDIDCPLALPHDIGTSLLFSSPAYFLLIPAFRRSGRTRLVAGAVIAIVLIGLLNRAAFLARAGSSSATGSERPRAVRPAPLRPRAGDRAGRFGCGYALIAMSIAIVTWGVIWGHMLGW